MKKELVSRFSINLSEAIVLGSLLFLADRGLFSHREAIALYILGSLIAAAYYLLKPNGEGSQI